ncbi:MAG: cutinase family protein [Egibacteraceae bacterium]
MASATIRRLLMVCAALSTLSITMLSPLPDAAASAQEGISAASASCPQIHFIGVRGSGETYEEATSWMGPVVEAVFDRFAQQMPVDVDGFGLDYPAVRVPELIAQTITRDFAEPIPGFAWFTPSVAAGAKELEAEVRGTSHDCIVLAGYSQGAWVIGEFLNATANTGLHVRLKAVVLFADPRFEKDSAIGVGATTEPGILQRYHPDHRPTTYLPEVMDRAHSYCVSGDPVCNNRGLLQGGLDRYPKCANPPSFQPLDDCKHLGRHYTAYIKQGADFLAETLMPSVVPPVQPKPQPAQELPTAPSSVHFDTFYGRLVWTDNADNEHGFRVYADDLFLGTAPADATTGPDNPVVLGSCNVVLSVSSYNNMGESTRVASSNKPC